MAEDFQDRYEIISRIGAGGVGAVYKAKDTRLGRMVAVKRLLPPDESEDQAKLGSDLAKEARALSAFQHPNIITVFDYGEDEDGFYIIMELLEGETMEELAMRSQLHFDTVTELAEQCLEGLSVAHARDLLHRDLKPSNLFVTTVTGGESQVKILDFGLAKFSSQPALQTVDQSRSILGSIYFMAPEQFLRQPLDARCDLYQLGCVFFYALTSEYAFDGETTANVMDAHLDHTPRDLAALRPDVPEDLRKWVLSLIAREPEDRPASAAEALQQLRVIARDNGIAASPPLAEETTAPVSVQTNTGGVELSATEAFLQKQRDLQEKKTAAKRVTSKQISTPVWIGGVGVLALVFAGIVISAFKTDEGSAEKEPVSLNDGDQVAESVAGKLEVDLNAGYAVYHGEKGSYLPAEPGTYANFWNDLAPRGGLSFAVHRVSIGADPKINFPTYVTEALSSADDMRPGIEFKGDQLLVFSGEGGGAPLSNNCRQDGAVSFFALVRPEADLKGYASIMNTYRSSGPSGGSAELIRDNFYSIFADDREVGFLLSQKSAILKGNVISVRRASNAPVLCEIRIEKDRKTVTVTSWDSEGKSLKSDKRMFAEAIYLSNQFHLGRLRGAIAGIPEVSGRLHNFRGTLFGLRVASGDDVTLKNRGQIAKEMWAGIVPDVKIPDLP